MQNSVNGDHWYHIQRAYEKILSIIYAKQDKLNAYKVRDLLHIASVIILLLALAMHQLYKHRPYWSLTLLLGLGVYLNNHFPIGLYSDPHPVLRGLPLVLSGVFGVNSFSFRTQGFLAVFCFMIWVCMRAWPLWQRLFVIVLSLSVPVVYFTVPLVEFSIWPWMLLSIFLIRISDNKELTERELLIFAMSFVMVCMIRQTMILGFAVLILYCLVYKRYKSIYKCLLIGIPVCFQIFNAYKHNNPAAYVADEKFLELPTHLSLFGRMVYSLQPANLQSILASTGLPLLGLILVCFIILGMKRRYRVAVIAVFFAVFSWMLFHSIRPLLWGVPRYQAEYIIPLSLMGAVLLLLERKKIGVLCLGALVVFNIGLLVKFYGVMATMPPDYPEWFLGKTPYISEVPFNVDEALAETIDGCASVRFVGTTYGNFPVIFAGVSLNRYSTIGQVKQDGVQCTYHLLQGQIPGGFFNSQRNTTVLLER